MTATTIRVQMAQRKDTAANWTAANPILLSGEIGYETDTEKFKIGDGTTNWNSLAYLPIPDGSGNLTITGNLEIGTTGTLTFEGSTADGFETTLAVTDPTADRTITLPDVSGTLVTTGDTGSVTSTMIAEGTIVDADVSATAEIAVSKLANGTVNQVIVTDGTNVSWSDNLTLAGDLTVNGTTTTINTETLTVKDKNIELAVVDTPTDVTADGGGITLKGTTDKTINWVDATDAWTSSEHVDLASGKSYRINGTEVLSATTLGSGVTGSSLTSVGTLGSLTVTDSATAGRFIPTSVTAPTNGLYLPAANSVALSTNGTGRLFINASGQTFLNQTSQLSNHSAPSFELTGDTVINSASFGTGNASSLYFYHRRLNDTATRPGSSIHSITEDSYTSGNVGTFDSALVLRTVLNNVAGDRLRITSAGLVGIGTSSPNSLTEIRGTNAGAEVETLRLTNNSTTTGTSSSIIFNLSTVSSTSAKIAAIRTNSPISSDTELAFSQSTNGVLTERLRITSAGVLQVADAGNIAVGTTTGTKIGTATTQKLGFFNKTPVVQPAAVADATDAASVITQLNALLARMRDLGLIAT